MSRTQRLIATTALSLGTLLAGAAQAQSWQFLPMLNDPAFKLEPTIALTGSRVMPSQGGDANAWGVDINVNCGLVQSPDRRIRTHINLTRSDETGIKTTGFELSPRYTMPLPVAGLSLGVGPSLAAFKVESAGTSQTLTGIGAAADLNFRSGSFYAGADLRAHATGEKSGVDTDPVTLGVKVGFSF